MRTWVQSLALIRVAISCGIGHRQGLDPALLWLWHRLAAVAQIQHLAYIFPYVMCAALKSKAKKKKSKKQKRAIIPASKTTISKFYFKTYMTWSNFTGQGNMKCSVSIVTFMQLYYVLWEEAQNHFLQYPSIILGDNFYVCTADVCCWTGQSSHSLRIISDSI